jgi:hypothetical protein
MDSWIQILSLNVSIFSVFIIPSIAFFYHKLKEMDTKFTIIIKTIDQIKKDHDKADYELNKN